MSDGDGLDLVLKERGIRARVLNERLAALESVRAAILAAEESIVRIPDLEQQRSGVQSLRSVEEAASQARAALLSEIEASRKLLRRFERGAVWLGAIGRTGQGKSAFLKTLTGLSDQEIPSQAGSFCTGVATRIEDGNPPQSMVHFLAPERYFDWIVKYHEELGLTPPTSLEQFWSHSLPAQPQWSERKAERVNLYAHLEKHWAKRDRIRDLLGKPPMSIQESEIARYVTQATPDGDPLDDFRAVDFLALRTPYPAGDSRVSLIDLPGLGDSNLTDIEIMLSAISDQVDAVVLVRAGTKRRDDWQDTDIRLYTYAQDALPEISMSERAFLLINHIPSEDNLQACELLKAEAEGKAISVADIDIVDAQNTREVEAYFRKVIAALPQSLGRADARLMQVRDIALAETLASVQVFLTSTRGLVGMSSPVTEMRRTKLVREARRELAQALESLKQDLKKDAGLPIPALTEQFAEAIKEARSLVGRTTNKEFLARSAEKGNRTTAYNDLLQETRAQLGARFASLDPVLKAQLEGAKAAVGDVLAGHGLLGPVIGEGGAAALKQLLTALDDPLLDLDPDSPLRSALQTLTDAELTYRGFLQHAVRRCFEPLDPDRPAYPPSDFSSTGDVSKVPAATFLKAIEATARSCLLGERGVEFVLMDRAPADASWAIFAVVEEFVERALHSKGSEEEWDSLYRRFQEQIWHEEFTEAARTDSVLAAVLKSLRAVDKAVARARTASPGGEATDDGEEMAS